MSLLHALECSHRLEEICERFGFFATPRWRGEAPVALEIAIEAFARVRIGGLPLGGAALHGRCAGGLRADERALHIEWSDPQADLPALERDLLALFEGLMVADPASFYEKPRRVVSVPSSGELPQSKATLERFYGGDFLPREKKPAVIDLARSQGPWLRSIDQEPLQIIDAASQIASLASGVRPDAVQRALDEGAFDALVLAAGDAQHEPSAQAFDGLRAALSAVASFGLEHACFTNGGSEANEKAFHIARLNGPGGRRVLAFEGAFHGRTLLPLYATWNRSKRSAFQLDGFEATFLTLPALEDAYNDPPIPALWRQAWANPEGARAEFKGSAPDLDAEVDALCAVEAAIREGDVLAVIIEPYQCEGGDRTASRRFFNGLRALTRGYGVPLIFDEVQSGFGLSGKPFWHQNFNLIDAEGRPDAPDLVTGAKRAQLGYVLSRWPDPAPGFAHAASALRGQLHLETLLTHPGHQGRARQQLDALVEAFPTLVSQPRAFGDAFAFDLPNATIANQLIAQRFYRGYMVYIAGERTLRYRLNRSMTVAEVDRIFEVIHSSLSALIAQAGGLGDDLIERISAQTVPAWVPGAPPRHRRILPDLEALLQTPTGLNADRILSVRGELSAAQRALGAAALGLAPSEGRGARAVEAARAADAVVFHRAVGVPLRHWLADALGTRLRRVEAAQFDALSAQIEQVEIESYEPARRDSLAYLRTLVEAKDSICLIAEDPQGLVGFAFSAPLELFTDQHGPAEDAHRGVGNTLYSADITVAPRARRQGLGLRMKLAQIAHALPMRDDAGAPRYRFITGRNRVGHAEAMWRLNQSLGAYEVGLYMGQYGELEGIARYYRIPLRRFDRGAAPARYDDGLLDLASGVWMPTGEAHPHLQHARRLGVFDEAALTKLTVSNFITPAYARAAEYLRAIAPQANPHMYFTSCADEMVDKTLRALKFHRAEGQIAVGFEGGYFGTNTAACRSLSGEGGTGPEEGHFGWPILAHPAQNLGACLAGLDTLVAERGPEAILGVFIESVQWRTGRALDAASWAALCAWRDRTGVPLVLSETTTGLYRNGTGRFFWVDGMAEGADVVLWWAGGQIGHIFSNDRSFVAKPLTLISTWDGDELSATRLLWQMYVARDVDVGALSEALDRALQNLPAGVRAGGLGLYRSLLCESEAAAEQLYVELLQCGVTVGHVEGAALIVSPALSITERQIKSFGLALREIAAQRAEA